MGNGTKNKLTLLSEYVNRPPPPPPFIANSQCHLLMESVLVYYCRLQRESATLKIINGIFREKFPGLVLPPLPKRDLIGDSAVQGKIILLEKFLHTIATTGKLVTHHVTLQFLG